VRDHHAGTRAGRTPGAGERVARAATQDHDGEGYGNDDSQGDDDDQTAAA
jgi:hypothetical protein